MSGAGRLFREALQKEKPLQIVGAINAYAAMLAERTGLKPFIFQARGCQCLFWIA